MQDKGERCYQPGAQEGGLGGVGLGLRYLFQSPVSNCERKIILLELLSKNVSYLLFLKLKINKFSKLL